MVLHNSQIFTYPVYQEVCTALYIDNGVGGTLTVYNAQQLFEAAQFMELKKIINNIAQCEKRWVKMSVGIF